MLKLYVHHGWNKGLCTIQALSVLQFKKGLKRDEEGYLAILKEYDNEEVSPKPCLPMEVQVVLDKFEDVMPEALPKRLPPRREVHHEIELEHGTRPPAKSPY